MLWDQDRHQSAAWACCGAAQLASEALASRGAPLPATSEIARAWRGFGMVLVRIHVCIAIVIAN